MKMSFLFTGAFWGVILIVLGLSVILKTYFNIDIPVIRTLFGLLIIVMGVSILLGRPLGCHSSRHVVFGEGSFKNIDNGDFNVIFGKGVTDLSGVTLDEPRTIEVNTIFADNTVYYDSKMPVEFLVNAAFAEARLPDNQTANFGNARYHSPAYEKGKPVLTVKINVVFGSVKIREK